MSPKQSKIYQNGQNKQFGSFSPSFKGSENSAYEYAELLRCLWEPYRAKLKDKPVNIFSDESL